MRMIKMGLEFEFGWLFEWLFELTDSRYFRIPSFPSH